MNLTNASYLILIGTKNFTERYYRDKKGWLKVSARGRKFRMTAEQVLNHLLPAAAGVKANLILKVERRRVAQRRPPGARSRGVMMCPIALVLAVACVFANGLCTVGATTATTASTTQQVRNDVDRESAHFARVAERLKKHPTLATDPYIRLDLAIARRFIDRAHHLDPAKAKMQEPRWTAKQMDEVGQILADAEKTIDAIEAGKLPEGGLGPVPLPTGGPVKIEQGVFVTETKAAGDSEAKVRPVYLGGYGHFQQVVEDLPNFRELGATLIQDGRNGPKQGLNPDLSLTPAGREVKQMLARAAKANVKVDILTSPHYFPDWAVAAAPDMPNGSPFHNIDHPKQREVNEAWLAKLAAQNSDEPALLSYCLSNEPVYSASGRDKYSAPAWGEFLKRRHQTIEHLNQWYGMKFKSFDEVPADGWDESDNGRRRAYDWVCFNNEHFAAWHKWMGEVFKKQDPRALTHAKIMVFFALDNEKAGWGIDPECFADATDIAGCDAYAQMGDGAGVGPLDESTSKEYAYHWQVEEMSYDLLNSFKNQPVFNSENHPIPNATGVYEYPAKHTRAVMWQGGLHHMGASTTWVWEEAKEDSLLDSIYFRPSNIWGQARAFLDLNRLSAEVTAINRAEPTVAILYSPSSVFWEKEYAKTLLKVYTALVFAAERVTFVSEKQLAAHRGYPPSLRRIILPMATHVSLEALKFLVPMQFVYVGADCAKWDEYHRPNNPLAADKVIPPGDERALWEALRMDSGAALLDADGKPAWGIEFRTVPYENGYLVPMINHLKQAQTVSLSVEGMGDEAVDLLTRQIVSTRSIKLEPMEPVLLRVERK